MAQDPYYRQMLEWSKQQAAQQAQRQQEQVNIQRINEERDRLRREHLERTRIYEAQTLATAAASAAAGAGAGGSGNRTPEVDNSSSGTIIFNGIDVDSGGSYISAPGATITNWLPGTDDFTVEWFQYQTATGHPRVFSIGPDTSPSFGLSIEGNKVYTWPGGTNWAIPGTYLNTWTHIAVVRKGGTMSAFVNGATAGTPQKNSYTAASISGATYSLYIGSDGFTDGDTFTGKITNFRWTNSAVYTGTFSRPTSALTQLVQTKLLMLGGNITNPVIDSTGINVLTNFNTTWSSDTPFS